MGANTSASVVTINVPSTQAIAVKAILSPMDIKVLKFSGRTLGADNKPVAFPVKGRHAIIS